MKMVGNCLSCVFAENFQTSKRNIEGKYSKCGIHNVQARDRNLCEMKLHNGGNVLQILYDIQGKTVGK